MQLTDLAKVDNLRALLSGPAQMAFNEIKTAAPQQHATSWQYIAERMKERFSDERASTLREVEFLNLVQLANETPDAFANALKELSHKAFQNVSAEERNRQLKLQFL